MAKPAPAVTLLVPPQFKPIIADVIVHWGDLDDKLDCLRDALAAQPSCSAVAPAKGGVFRRRLNHFEHMATTYFAEVPSMVSFVRRTCERIRTAQGERDLVAHGRYGFEGSESGELKLRLWDAPGGPDRARSYSLQHFDHLLEEIKVLLAIVRILYRATPGMEEVGWEAWGFREPAISAIQSLLSPIRDHCLRATRPRYSRSPPEAGRT